MWKHLAALGLSKWLAVAGLIITLVGSGIGAAGAFATAHDAFEFSLARWAGDTQEDNVQNPAAQNILRQSRLALWGFGLIAMGTGLQLAGLLAKPQQP